MSGSKCLSAALLAFGLASPTLAQPRPGDYLVVSRTYGTVYAVEPVTGLIRCLVSGLELRDQSQVLRGDGPTLSASFGTTLAATASGSILARFATSTSNYGLMSIASASGERILLPGTDEPRWSECGVVMTVDDGTILTTADAWAGGYGRVLRYDPTLQTTTVISGRNVGDGPLLRRPRALGMLNPSTLLVAELNLPPSGAGLYTVDIPSGNRTFLSRLSQQSFQRPLIVNGDEAGTVLLGDDEGGSGPISNLQLRSVVVIDGRVLVGESILKPEPDATYDGGILEVDPVTGDRSLLVGRALADDGTGQTVVTVLPSNASEVYLDAPVGLLRARAGRLGFTCLFGPSSIFEFDLQTHELFEIADIAGQIDPGFVGNLCLSGLTVHRGPPPAGSVLAWGSDFYGQCNVPAPNTAFVAVATFSLDNLGLKADGSIVAWGRNDHGQSDVPAPNANFMAVAAGDGHNLGLKSDGSIAAWGWNDDGQCDVPTPNADFAAVGAGAVHSLGVKADGSVVAWGANDHGQCDVPPPNAGFVAVAGGYWQSLGLKDDGSIVAWGDNSGGQCDVPAPNAGFVAVAAGWFHSLGLKADGSIIAWGEGPGGPPAPNSAFIAAAAGYGHNLGLKSDGSIVAWGYDWHGQCDVPTTNTSFAAIAAGAFHSLGLKASLLGDLNCDGIVNGLDVYGFVLALVDPASYAMEYPDWGRYNGDFSGDGEVSEADIVPFAQVLAGGW
jgi:hypothetical protein